VVAFDLQAEEFVGDHHFAVYDCGTRGDTSLSDLLADRVRSLYVDPNELREALESAATGLDDIADEDALQALVAKVTAAVVPQPAVNPRQPAHLDLARNEVAEVIAYEAVEAVHGAVIPAARVREKEVPGQPTRGLDLLALLVGPTLTLVVTEVKASSSSSSPPAVVCSGDDSLHQQTKALVADDRRLLRELTWSFKHCQDAVVKDSLARAMLLLSNGKLPILAAPVLVRPVDKHGAADFGCFKDDPTQYPPARIDFCLARIEGSLETLAGEVYTKARQAA
jgi:hypothetical protein